MGYSLALKRSIATKRKNRREIIKKALRGSSNIYSLEDLKSRAPWDYQSFTQDISKVFPSIVRLHLDGMELAQINALMGFPWNWLNDFFYRYKEIGNALKEARKAAKTDRAKLSEIIIKDPA